MLNDLLYRLRALIHRREMDAEVDDELRDHIERETEKYRRAGLTPNEAVRRAHLALGGSEQVKQQSRDSRGTKFVEDLLQDLRYAMRSFAKTPGPHGADRAFAGDRHRREHSNLQHHQHAATQALALSRP